MTWLILLLTGSALAADDCPESLAATTAALESAATELELAAANLEALEIEADSLDADLEEAEEELDHAVELLQLFAAAAEAAPDQPIGEYKLALACFFDEEACPFEDPESLGADEAEDALQALQADPEDGPIAPIAPPKEKKGLFGKKR